MNQRYVRGLFYETTPEDKSNVMYTLKERDHKGYPSLYRLYMESNDPTEWSFANKYLDGYEHWEMMVNSIWFKPFLKRWRRDLDLKIRSEALIRVQQEARNGGTSKFTANRFLLEKGWEAKQTKGRPTKDDIKREANRVFEHDRRIQEDMERLSL